MREIHLERAEIVRSPVTGRLESEALRVDHRDNRNLGVAVWQVGTASAAIVRAVYDQMVLVVDKFAVASRLDGRHHKLVFRAQLLLLARLLVLDHRVHFVVDLRKINGHFATPLGSLGIWARDVLLNEVSVLSVVMGVNVESHALLDCEVDVGATNLAV